jgi:tricorn protease
LRGDLPALAKYNTVIDPHAIVAGALSPEGVRAVFEAHGDIFTVPAEKGDTRNITKTSDAAERDPAWSPDGKSIAYFSDESGEYQLVIQAQNGLEAPKIIDLGPSPSFFYSLQWSSDSKYILYTDKKLNIWFVSVDIGKPIKVDTDNYASFEISTINPTWSPDGKWIAYLKTLHNYLHAIYVYSIITRTAIQITDGMSDVENIGFDKSGKYLYFTASTDIGPSAARYDLSSLDRGTSNNVYLIVLSKDTVSPFTPESDDENKKHETT